MKSFIDMPKAFNAMPADVAVQLGHIDVSKGREQLYKDQMPELLQALSQQSRVESIRASNAIEGIEVGEDRAEKLADTDRARPRNRDEKEFAGYRDAMDEIMRADELELPGVPYSLHLHRTLFRYTQTQGGSLKAEDNLIGIKRGNVVVRVDFRPPPHQQTEGLLVALFGAYEEAQAREMAHPLVLLAGLIVDFLAIHPVDDGNGRAARLLTAHEMVRLGYGVARYSSVEQRVWETKNRYYDSLRDSQQGWHEGEHDIWPWCRYLITVIRECYDRFEARVAEARDSSGMSKQERVEHWIENLAGKQFRIGDIRRAVPGVSDGTIHLAMNKLKDEAKIQASGSGPKAHWERLPSLGLAGRRYAPRPPSRRYPGDDA